MTTKIYENRYRRWRDTNIESVEITSGDWLCGCCGARAKSADKPVNMKLNRYGITVAAGKHSENRETKYSVTEVVNTKNGPLTVTIQHKLRV